MDTTRILEKLDEYLGKNDYLAAERHLLYWLRECLLTRDDRTALLMHNELMGLYRKQGMQEQALREVQDALALVSSLGLADTVSGATTYLNCATVYKAFDRWEDALPLYERARLIYERDLPEGDERFGGLYNNMALALVDAERYDEANDLYARAISVMEASPDGGPEVAITLLNMADALEAQYGILEREEELEELLERAKHLLDSHPTRDGYYAFVCEKCAPIFGYHGDPDYMEELCERARSIYEGT